MNTAVLAIDIGASSGRHMLGKLENGKLTLEEIYRFPNGTVKKNGRLCWDHQALLAHILAGMKKCAELGQIPASVGVDTWGVDYVLVDEDGRMLSDGVAYRDDRTQAVLGLLPDDELYRRTGIAKQPFNTVYQLMTEPKERLQKAHRLLFTPDHFHYLLSGKMVNEYTIASTGALVNPVTRTWDAQVLRMASVPESLFPEAPKMPGTVLGRLRPEVAAEVGFDCSVIPRPTTPAAPIWPSPPGTIRRRICPAAHGACWERNWTGRSSRRKPGWPVSPTRAAIRAKFACCGISWGCG